MQEFLQNNYRTILELIVVVVILWLGYLVVDMIFYHSKLKQLEKDINTDNLDEFIERMRININLKPDVLDAISKYRDDFPNCTSQDIVNFVHDYRKEIERKEESKKWERQLFFELRIRSVKRKQNYQSRKRRLSYGINRNYQRHL